MTEGGRGYTEGIDSRVGDPSGHKRCIFSLEGRLTVDPCPSLLLVDELHYYPCPLGHEIIDRPFTDVAAFELLGRVITLPSLSQDMEHQQLGAFDTQGNNRHGSADGRDFAGVAGECPRSQRQAWVRHKTRFDALSWMVELSIDDGNG